MSEEEEKLLPCPFCGGEAYLKRIGNEHCKKMQVKVTCTTIGCMAFQQASTLTKFMAKRLGLAERTSHQSMEHPPNY